jgi:hypothetical protein
MEYRRGPVFAKHKPMKSMIPSRIALVVVLLFAAAACNRSDTVTEQTRPVPTAEDIRIGRRAISVNEVSLLARSGMHKEALAAVVQRRVPQELDAEEELKLRGFAKPELLAALKDPQNILTPAQKDAYDEARSTQLAQKEQAANSQAVQINNQRQLASTQTEQAWASSVAEQQETERRRRLNDEAIYEAERAKAERAAREREQLRSVEARWKNIEVQNTYPRTYSTPPLYRRDRVRDRDRDRRPADSSAPSNPGS